MGCTPHDFVKLFLGGVHRLAYTNFMRSLTETAVKILFLIFCFFFLIFWIFLVLPEHLFEPPMYLTCEQPLTILILRHTAIKNWSCAISSLSRSSLFVYFHLIWCRLWTRSTDTHFQTRRIVNRRWDVLTAEASSYCHPNISDAIRIN